jgi:hypothetical protein
LLKFCSSKLFHLKPNSSLPHVIEFPCHLERSVGVSPYLHATLELQKLLLLDRHPCTSILYHCVTNESPYYFFTLHKEIKESSIAIQNSLSAMSPVDLGTWSHTGMQRLVAEKSESKLNQVLPRRHQPHNEKGTSNTNIALSIENLIKLCEL